MWIESWNESFANVELENELYLRNPSQDVWCIGTKERLLLPKFKTKEDAYKFLTSICFTLNNKR